MRFPKGTTEHPINKSGKRKILVSVWDFGVVHPQSERNYYCCNDHPAKMRPSLARAILQLYAESPVLDPMAGIGTTLVEAILLGMNAIGVEYERKFVKQANENIKHVQKSHSNVGKAVCIQGDARDLSCLNNKKASSVLLSPPYFDAVKAVSTGHQGPESGHLKRQHKLAKEGKSGYGSKDNIGHAETYGSIIFSPPYFDALSLKKGGGSRTSIIYEETTKELQMKRSGPFAVKKNLPSPYSSKEENIGNIAQFGSIVLSPPYFCSISDVVKSRYRYPVTKHGLSRRQEYSGDPSNIGNIAKFGSIVFSPPYVDALSQQGGRQIAYMKGKKGDKFNDDSALPYSEDINNIGNMVGQTYLGEMFKVYRECYRVLKPGKFMVVVVKDIQRNWKTIPLGADTIKLCQLAGFDCHDVIINKMYFPSFWMLNLAKKAQTEGRKEPYKFHALKTHEYVLIFRKPSS